jgi:hypothetical protein
MTNEKVYSIDQPKIISEQKGGITLGLPDSHLVLECDDVIILMKAGRSQHATMDKMRKGLKAIQQEIKLEEWRKSKDYQGAIKS